MLTSTLRLLTAALTLMSASTATELPRKADDARPPLLPCAPAPSRARADRRLSRGAGRRGSGPDCVGRPRRVDRGVQLHGHAARDQRGPTVSAARLKDLFDRQTPRHAQASVVRAGERTGARRMIGSSPAASSRGTRTRWSTYRSRRGRRRRTAARSDGAGRSRGLSGDRIPAVGRAARRRRRRGRDRRASASPTRAGELGIAEGVPAGWQRILIDVRIRSAASEAEVRQVVETADRLSPMLANLSPGIVRVHRLTVGPKAGSAPTERDVPS